MAEQINVNEFKPGVTFLKEGVVFLVLEATHSKSGRGQAHVKVKAKNMFTGTTNVITYTGGERVEKAFVSKTKMQFLYSDGVNSNFMDNETFEQIEIADKLIKEELQYLIESIEVMVTSFDGRILGVEIPKNVTLVVSDTSDAVKGDTVTNATKKATLETGIEIDVPQFVNKNDKVVVNTETGKYVSRG